MYAYVLGIGDVIAVKFNFNMNNLFFFPCEDEPQYLSSQSYMADSSLSEEMSQFDFSTGVQSFSYSSQDPMKSQKRNRKKVQKNISLNKFVRVSSWYFSLYT